jgi:hypothetical protein
MSGHAYGESIVYAIDSLARPSMVKLKATENLLPGVLQQYR